MARSKAEPASPKNVAKATPPPGGSRAPAIIVIDSLRRMSRRQAKALLSFAVVGVLAWGSISVWRWAAPSIVVRERYLLPASAITISAPPEWITADVRREVIQAAGLDRRLSVLDAGFIEELRAAFAMHPWVKQVGRIEKSFPPAVRLDIVFRKPVAVIDLPLGSTGRLLPVDERSVHLPAADVPPVRREHLPRIMAIVGQPPEGQPWDDPRVPGAVDIAVRLADVWDSWHLMEITPSARPEVNGDRQYYIYDIVTRGGTHIMWGAAPLAAVPGEADFLTNRRRLERCVNQYGPLNSPEKPGTVNVRGELEVSPRLVREMSLEQRKAALDVPTVVK